MVNSMLVVRFCVKEYVRIEFVISLLGCNFSAPTHSWREKAVGRGRMQPQGQRLSRWFGELWIGVGGWGGDGRDAHIIRDTHNKYMHLQRPQYTREHAIVSLKLWSECQGVNADSFIKYNTGQSPNFSEPAFPHVMHMRQVLLPWCCVLRII